MLSPSTMAPGSSPRTDVSRPDRRPTFFAALLLAAVAAFLVAWSGIRAGLAVATRGPSASEREAAIQAADVGLQYALARLQADPSWRGNSPGPAPYLRPGLSVLEESGNVLGLLEPVAGGAAHFRLRFNLEDGSGGPDGLEDTPPGRLRLQVDRVSLNNLKSREPLAVPGGESVPAASAYLAVEGLSGPGLSPGTSHAGHPARRVLQAWCILEAVGGHEAESGPSVPPVAGGRRTLDGVDLGLDVAGPGNRDWGEGRGDHSVGTRGAPPSATPGGGIPTPGAGGAFSEADWAAIPKASASSPGDSQLRGGIYVWRVDSGGPYLEYFDHPPGLGPLPPAGDGIRVDGASLTAEGRGLQVAPASLTLVLTRNIAVVPSENGHRGLALRTDPMVTSMGGWPRMVFRASDRPILSSAGPIRLEAAVSGQGSITSEAELQVQGPSILDSDPGAGVALYARGDLTVEAVPREVADLRQDYAQFVETWVLTRNRLPTMADYRAARQSGAGPAADPGLGLGAEARAAWETSPALAVGKLEQFRRIITRFGGLEYADQSLAGSLVTWGHFNAERGVRGQGPARPVTTIQGPGQARSALPGKLRLQRTVWSGD